MASLAVTAPVRRATVALLFALGLPACSDVTTELIASPRAVTRDASAGDRKDAHVLSDAEAAVAQACGGRPCACNDGLDQDGDGLSDGFDPECTGPFDDDEASFGTGGPTLASPECQDCFWDHNQDNADDTCVYPRECTLTGDPPATGSACSECRVENACIDHCRPSTPNGCDCFGCCEVTNRSGTVVVNVLLAEGCSVMNLNDPQACPRCTPSATCRNPCGTCELCLGRKRRDLPMSCRGKPNEEPTPTCDDGERTCSDTNPCPFPFYCNLGCCLVTVI